MGCMKAQMYISNVPNAVAILQQSQGSNRERGCKVETAAQVQRGLNVRLSGQYERSTQRAEISTLQTCTLDIGDKLALGMMEHLIPCNTVDDQWVGGQRVRIV